MKTVINNRTDFLIRKRSFFTGFSNVFNISGETVDFNTSSSSEEADCKAIESDWKMVGEDIRSAIKRVLTNE